MQPEKEQKLPRCQNFFKSLLLSHSVSASSCAPGANFLASTQLHKNVPTGLNEGKSYINVKVPSEENAITLIDR